MNHLKNGTIAVGAPGSEMRKRAEAEDAAKGKEMSKSKHTAGPWKVLGRIRDPRRVAIGPDRGHAGSYTVAETGPYEGDNSEQNAERIVACVNAMEGIDDPAIVPELVAALENFVTFYCVFVGPDSDDLSNTRVYREALALLARVKGLK